MKLTQSLALAGVLVFIGTLAQAVDKPDPGSEESKKGRAIAEKIDETLSNYVDSQVNMEMILRNQHGQEVVRNVKTKNIEVKGDGDKSLVLFLEPKDVRGTAFLSFTHKTGDDDRWLYLPALKRVKRIDSGNKSGPFMGSEFAFEDISPEEPDKFTYKFLREDKVDGKTQLVMERYPVDKNSGYVRQIVWVDKERYVLLKIEFYDRKNSHLKTLTYNGYKKYAGKHWRAESMEMINHRTGKSTFLRWKGYEFEIGLTSRDFDKNSLKRVR